MAEATYRRVVPTFWSDPDVKRVLTRDQKTLLIYLFTNRHAHPCGLYHLPPLYVMDELGFTEAEVLETVNGPLRPFVTYDSTTEEVFVHAMAEHQIGALHGKDNRITWVEKQVVATLSDDLKLAFRERYEEWNLDWDEVAPRPDDGPPPPPEFSTEPPDDPEPSPTGDTGAERRADAENGGPNQAPSEGPSQGPHQASSSNSSSNSTSNSARTTTTSGSLRSPGANCRAVDVEKPARDWEADWLRLMGYARSTAGLGELPDEEIQRNGSVLKQWRKEGLSAEDAWLAISGACLLVDAGKITWLPAGSPFGLRALKARTIQREGNWPVWAAALEAARIDPAAVTKLPVIDELVEGMAMPEPEKSDPETEKRRRTLKAQIEAARREERSA